jgi:hypothetical protein
MSEDALKLRDGELDKLAEAAFNEEERMLPEGETWADQDDGRRAYYRNLVIAVFREIRRLRANR